MSTTQVSMFGDEPDETKPEPPAPEIVLGQTPAPSPAAPAAEGDTQELGEEVDQQPLEGESEDAEGEDAEGDHPAVTGPTIKLDPAVAAAASEPAAPQRPIDGIIVRIHGAEVRTIPADTKDDDIVRDFKAQYPEIRAYKLTPVAERPRVERDGKLFAIADFKKSAPVNGQGSLS